MITLDKYEYRMKTEQMLSYIDEKEYQKAMQIADTIDWRRVKNTVILCATSEVYEQNGKFDKSRDILFIAYDRAPENKKIIYKLGILALKQGDLGEAMDCYDEFVAIAPKDPNQYILRYKILKLQSSSVLLQIETLKTFKAMEHTERWAYELAKLYDEAGMQAECMSECDDLILWFREGDYLKEVLELKRKHHALTQAQENLYVQLMAGGRTINPVEMLVQEQVHEQIEDAPVYQQAIYEEVPFTPEMVQNQGTVYEQEMEVDHLGDTKIISQEDLQKINQMSSVLTEPDEVTPVNLNENYLEAPMFTVRGASVGGAVAEGLQAPGVGLESSFAAGVGAAAGLAAGMAGAAMTEGVSGLGGVESLGSVIPTGMKTNTISGETTGQLRIDEILSGWEEKQRAVEEAIAIEKAKGLEKAAQEAKLREEEKAAKEAEAQKDIPSLPDDIRRMILDIEGGNLEPAYTEMVSEPVVESVPEEVAVEPEVFINSDAPVYIEEEFHDNVFEAEEEYSEMLNEVPVLENTNMIADEAIVSSPSYEESLKMLDPSNMNDESVEDSLEILEEKSVIQEELDDIEAILAQGDLEAAMDSQEIMEELAEESIEEYMEEPMDQDLAIQEHAFVEDIDLLEEVTPMSRIDAAKAVATGRTMKLPTEEIMKAAGGVNPDTGFIVQAKYDLDAQSEIGLRAGLNEEQKKLFSYFVPVRGMSEQLVEVLDRDKNCLGREGTSNTGNLLIVGRKGSGKTVLAVDVVKAIQKNRGMSNGKVAIVTGEALNKKKISDIIGKLYGGALIIEKASLMNEKTITRLNKAMERETGEILVVLEDERKPLDSILATNLEFRRRFTSRLEVPVFINDELVTFGQAYAKENGYKIDEMGILALYSRIDRDQKDNYNVSVADVKSILDEAIENSLKGGVKKLAQKLFKKGESEDAKIILSEKHFNM